MKTSAYCAKFYPNLASKHHAINNAYQNGSYRIGRNSTISSATVATHQNIIYIYNVIVLAVLQTLLKHDTVVRFETVHLLLALTALNNWYITGLDVRNAYLYGVLAEIIYMEQPEGFRIKGSEDKVLILRKALYGLKQAGLVWWRTLDLYMKTLGFKCLSSDAGIFVRHGEDGSIVVAVIYVDDALFAGPDKKLVDSLKGKFKSHWECRDLGDAKEFLRMWITCHGNKIYID